MKHNIVFVALLALILAFGYRGADLASLKDGRETSALNVERADSAGSPVFFTGKDVGFDPMNGVSGTEPAEKPSNYHAAVNVGAAIAASFSRYEPKNAYVSGETEPIVEAFRMSANGCVYADGYRYLNPAGETRVLDCIVNPMDYRIVYIRFYSPEKTAVDPRKAKTALEKFDAMYSEFEEMGDEVEEYLERAYSGTFLDFVPDDAFIASSDYRTVYSKLCRASDLFFGANAPQNKLFRFWIRPLSAASLNFRSTYGESAATTTSYIIFSMTSQELAGTPEYIAYDNSIFQLVRFGKKRLVVIYSIEDDCVEGFYAPPGGGDV